MHLSSWWIMITCHSNYCTIWFPVLREVEQTKCNEIKFWFRNTSSHGIIWEYPLQILHPQFGDRGFVTVTCAYITRNWSTPHASSFVEPSSIASILVLILGWLVILRVYRTLDSYLLTTLGVRVDVYLYNISTEYHMKNMNVVCLFALRDDVCAVFNKMLHRHAPSI